MSKLAEERRLTHEKRFGVALDDPNQVGTARFDGPPVPTSGVTWPPVLELADRRDLHSRDPMGRPGPIPGGGTSLTSADRHRLRNNST
jgi:hypothetical protein